jgi:hypothetical protein
MAKITRLSGEERENLVAYLDGELDPQQIREIELALGRSPVARHDVDMLARTWDLLDNLPQQQVGEQFVTETMSLVIGAEVGGEEVDPLAPLKARNRTLWWSFAVYVLPNETDELLRDYEIVAELDKYLEAEDAEYLQKLAEIKEFADPEEPHANP